MNIKETVSNAIKYGFAPVPRFKDKETGEWKLRKFINKDTGDYGYPLNHKAWVNDIPLISLVLLNCVLIDLDANKENCTDTIDDLKEKVCDLLNIDEFDLDMALFQENEKGDSLHYMFKLPGGVITALLYLLKKAEGISPYLKLLYLFMSWWLVVKYQRKTQPMRLTILFVN